MFDLIPAWPFTRTALHLTLLCNGVIIGFLLRGCLSQWWRRRQYLKELERRVTYIGHR